MAVRRFVGNFFEETLDGEIDLLEVAEGQEGFYHGDIIKVTSGDANEDVPGSDESVGSQESLDQVGRDEDGKDEKSGENFVEPSLSQSEETPGGGNLETLDSDEVGRTPYSPNTPASPATLDSTGVYHGEPGNNATSESNGDHDDDQDQENDADSGDSSCDPDNDSEMERVCDNILKSLKRGSNADEV